MKRTLLDARRLDFRRGNIVLPPNILSTLFNMKVPTEADIMGEVAAQAYPIGAQARFDGKLYRYSKAGEAMSAVGFLKCLYMQCPGKAGNSVNSGFEGAFSANVAAGATSFTIADTVAAKDEYEGAYFVVYNSTDNVWESHRVIRNDVSTGTITTLYIASPGFKNALTTAFGITIYRSPWSDVRAYSTGGGWASPGGYARMAITSGYFFWMQTAGEISGVTGASTWPGQTQYNRDVYANTDGSLIGSDDSATRVHYARIGYLLARTATDYGDNLVMLQLDQ